MVDCSQSYSCSTVLTKVTDFFLKIFNEECKRLNLSQEDKLHEKNVCVGEFLSIRSRTDGKILIKFDTAVWATRNVHHSSLKLHNIKVFFTLAPKIGETLPLVSQHRMHSNHGNQKIWKP